MKGGFWMVTLCCAFSVCDARAGKKEKKPKRNAQDTAKCIACRRIVTTIEDDIIRKIFPLDQEIESFASSQEPLERNRQKDKKLERAAILSERLPRVCDTTGFFFSLTLRDTCHELLDEFETGFEQTTSSYADYGGRSKIAEHVCGPKVSSACPADTDWSNMYGTMAKKVDDEALKVQKLPALSEQTLGAETLFGRRWLYDVNGPMLVELLEASEEGEIDVLAYYKTSHLEGSDFDERYGSNLRVFAAELAEAMKKEPQDVAPPIVVVQLDMDKNEMPKPWGSFMDVPTIVFYPSETPDNPQFLIDRVSPTMDIDNLGPDTFWHYLIQPELGASPRSNRIGLESGVARRKMRDALKKGTEAAAGGAPNFAEL